MNSFTEPRKYFALLFMDAMILTMTVFLIVPMEWAMTLDFFTEKTVLLRLGVLVVFILVSLFLFHMYGAYNTAPFKSLKLSLLISLGLSGSCTFLLWFCIRFPMRLYFRFPVAIAFFYFLFVYVLFSRKLSLVKEVTGFLRVLFVGVDPAVMEVAQFTKSSAPKKYEVLGILSEKPENASAVLDIPVFHIGGSLDDLFKKTDVFVFSLNLSSPEAIIKKIQSIRLNPDDTFSVYNLPTFYKELAGKVPVFTGNEEWLLYVKELLTVQRERGLILKRLTDILLSSLGMILLSPLFVMLALLIKISSKGPVFFRQSRIGLDGTPFEMLKFRTMVVGAETMKGLDSITEEKDERIIPAGNILRITHLDELPQFVNVLKGEMSLIGPRPLNKHLEQKFMNDVPGYTMRYLMRPGLTGWAQVNHYDSRSTEGQLQRFQYDLYYIRHSSLFLDFVIMLKTVKIMLLGRGAR